MIDEKYIKTFLPLHELDELKVNQPNVADLSSDDLFLISKVSAYSDNGENAVTISKKASYGTIINKVSVDFKVQEMKNDIATLSSDLSDLSDEVQQKYDDLISQISAASVILSTETSAEILSLSNWTDTNFIKKYGTSTSALVKVKDFDGVPKNMIATSIQLTNGKISDVTYDRFENYITIDGMKVAGGAILGDVNKTHTYTLNDANQTEIVYNVDADCYLNIEANIWEKDSSDKPLEVYLLNVDPDKKQIRAKLDQFNNPGGFSGKGYFNYYYSGFPIKQINDGTRSITSVLIKYSDSSKFAYDSSNKTTVKFTEYQFYATVAKSELSNYVPRADILSDGSTKSLYKFKFNEFGLVTEADPMRIDSSLTSLGVATSSQLGLVKLGASSGSNYGLKLNTSNQAYVTVPKASTTALGTVKIGSTTTSGSDGLTCDVLLTAADKAYVKVPKATSSAFGSIKIGSASIVNSSAGITAGVQLSSTGAGYIQVPAASTSRYGVIKVGSEPASGTTTNVYVGTDGVAKIKYETNLNFTTTAKTTLADADKILVNHGASNLQNYIQYSSLRNQVNSYIMSNLVTPILPLWIFNQTSILLGTSSCRDRDSAAKYSAIKYSNSDGPFILSQLVPGFSKSKNYRIYFSFINTGSAWDDSTTASYTDYRRVLVAFKHDEYKSQVSKTGTEPTSLIKSDIHCELAACCTVHDWNGSRVNYNFCHGLDKWNSVADNWLDVKFCGYTPTFSGEYDNLYIFNQNKNTNTFLQLFEVN